MNDKVFEKAKDKDMSQGETQELQGHVGKTGLDVDDV